MAKRVKSRKHDSTKGRQERKSPAGLRRIDDVLNGLMARRGYAQVQQTAEIQAAWNVADGEHFAIVSRPTQVKRGVLEVIVQNSAALQELMFQKNEILEKLTKANPEGQIKDLRFRVGTI